MSSRVFISYATQDKDIADQVLQFLESKDQSCWIAPRDIPPGSDWAESIIDGLDAARYMILILSSAVSSSPHIRRELERAVSRNITIFPMIIEEFDHPKWIQYYISAHQWIDAAPVSSKLRSRLDELLRTLVKSSVVNNNALSKVSGEKSEFPLQKGLQADGLEDSKRINGRRRRFWWFYAVGAALLVIAVYQFVHIYSKSDYYAYKQAERLYQDGDLDASSRAFQLLGDYGNSNQRLRSIEWEQRGYSLNNGVIFQGDTACWVAVTPDSALDWETLHHVAAMKQGAYQSIPFRLPMIVELQSLYEDGISVDDWGPFENSGSAVWSSDYGSSINTRLVFDFTSGEVIEMGMYERPTSVRGFLRTPYGGWLHDPVVGCHVTAWGAGSQEYLAGNHHDGQALYPDFRYVSVAAGFSHILALTDDGYIVASRSSYDEEEDYGQASDTPRKKDFIAVAAGYNFSLGLKADSSIVAWGESTCGQLKVPLPNCDFTAISAAGYHCLGLKADGSVIAWGDNSSGQCDVPNSDAIYTAIAAGFDHSLGLTVDGSIIAWGNNTMSQCDVPLPSSGFVAIAAGMNHSLGLKADGSIVSWGDNAYGQCSVPIPNSGFTKIAAGLYHSMALREDGSVSSWGANDGSMYDWGQVSETPSGGGIVSISAGPVNSIAITADGSIIAWGGHSLAQWDMLYSTGLVSASAGGSHSLGLRSNGFIVAWGIQDGSSFDYGQVTDTPVNCGFVSVSAGYLHSLGLRADGSITAWGDNSAGQCEVPSGNRRFNAVSAGEFHSLGLKDDGSVIAWGLNDDGQCDVPIPNAQFVEVAAGSNYSLGLRSNGSIVAWGVQDGSENDYGQVSAAPIEDEFIAISAGYWHGLALTEDSSVVAWGYNGFGQCDVPSPNGDFIAVSAGGVHSLGLKADGSIVAWGDNRFSQCAVTLPNHWYKSISAGFMHSIALSTLSYDHF